MSPVGSQNGVSAVNNHPEYYLKDGNITFIVENTRFCVHRHFFNRESQYFIQELARVPRDGTSDTNEFRLENVTSADFATLLWVWYSPTYRRDAKTKEHWLVILDLSTKWQFPEMKKLAIDELEKLEVEPIEKIVTYDKYQVNRSLLLPAFKFLCKRTTRLSTEEGDRLKMPTVLGLQDVREQAIRIAAESGCRSPTSADADDEVLDRLLNNVFNLSTPPTNGQPARTRGAQPPSVPIINNPRPDANGATGANGTTGTSGTGNRRPQGNLGGAGGHAETGRPK